jgi:teichuronic acid biosynthesis glycosyltransferase TuaC
MKVLFVGSGNSVAGISPILKNQGISLTKQGIDIDYYMIRGKGISGYLKNIFTLRIWLKHHKYELIHAHYSYSAFVASVAGAKPMIVSLMGSDARPIGIFKILIQFFRKIFSWKGLIVKSDTMRLNLNIKNVEIIPNGVDMSCFKPLDKNLCQSELQWDKAKRHILFAANPVRTEKHYSLAYNAVKMINDPTLELHSLENIPHDQIPCWLNASDIILLTSVYEGSPNIIKEAMACNRPIVCTNVGDVKELFGSVAGCFLTESIDSEVVQSIKAALSFKNNTHGRDRIIQLKLDSVSVASRIIEFYNLSINQRN